MVGKHGDIGCSNPVWLVNMVTLVAVIPREYKTLRWAGLEVFFCQLFVYGIAFAHFGHY